MEGKLDRNVRIVKDKPASRHVEDDDWRKSVEQRLSAQEGSIQQLVNLFHDFLGKLTTGASVANHHQHTLSSDYDGKVSSKELASATASTTGVHLEKTPTGPTPSSTSVGSSMVFTLENKPSNQPTVSSSILSSVSNSDMILVGDYQNKYNYGDLSPEEEWRSGELKKIAEDEILGFAKPLNDELTLDNISRATLSSLPDEVVGVMSLPSEDSVSERQEELNKEKEEQAKKKQSVESNKDVALEETINATAADAQQEARAIALDKQQLCKTSEALPVLASASSVSREREESLNLVNKEINLYHSMMDKEGNGEQDIMKAYKAAHEEIDDSTDGASSALINIDHDGKVTSEELDSATTNLKDAMAKDKAAGVLHGDEDEDHFPPVFEQVSESNVEEEEEDHFPPVVEDGESSSRVVDEEEEKEDSPLVTQAAGVLHDDEDEDHFPPVFEQAMSEERPTGVSVSDVEEEEEEEEEEDEEEEEEDEEEEEEDSPPVIQEEEEQPQKVDKKLQPLVRCKEKAFMDKMNALGEERLKLLEDSPFYKLLEMSGNVQNNKAINKLVSLFNTKDRSLLLPDGSRCVVTPQDFTSIMGVEDGDEVVIIPKKPVMELPSEQTIIFFVKKGGQWLVSNKKVEDELTQSKDRDTVKRAFALFALRNIVCPPAGNYLCWAYLNHVDDLNGLKKKKWATHALNFLVRGINTYKNSRGTGRKNLSGCTIFLLLYARKKISDTIPEEIPEPRRTKMIDKKLDELLKMPNKVNERTDIFENARLVKNIMQQRNESMIIAL